MLLARPPWFNLIYLIWFSDCPYTYTYRSSALLACLTWELRSPLWMEEIADREKPSPLYRVATRVTFFHLAMTSLPSQLPAHLLSSPQFESAYTLCLPLESKIQSEIATRETDKDRNELSEHLIYCRVLGYLLHHAPNDAARRQVHKEIVSCNGDAKLIQLGKMYFDHFIRACTYNPRSAFIFKLTYVSSSEEQRTDTRSIISRIPSILWPELRWSDMDVGACTSIARQSETPGPWLYFILLFFNPQFDRLYSVTDIVVSWLATMTQILSSTTRKCKKRQQVPHLHPPNVPI